MIEITDKKTMFSFKLRIIHVALKWLVIYTVYNLSAPPPPFSLYLSLVFKLLNISSQPHKISRSVGWRQPKNRSCLGVSRMTGEVLRHSSLTGFFSATTLKKRQKMLGNLTNFNKCKNIFFTMLFFLSIIQSVERFNASQACAQL